MKPKLRRKEVFRLLDNNHVNTAEREAIKEYIDNLLFVIGGMTVDRNNRKKRVQRGKL